MKSVKAKDFVSRFSAGLVVVSAAFCLVQPAAGAVISGSISSWQESGPRLTIGDGTNHVRMWWSINTFDKGWFYGSSTAGTDSDVAFASGVSDISQITNAAAFSYTNNYVGPNCDADCASNGVGDFLIWRNISTGHFGALRVDDIVSPGGNFNNAVLNGTWWFQTDGTGNFASNVPEPGTFALLSLGLLGLGFTARQKLH